MIKINEAFIDETSQKARVSTRKRMNYNFHPYPDDPLQRMLNAMEPDTYIQPHKHENPDKREAFFCLRGKILVVEYTDDGQIADHIILDPLTGNYGCEVAPRTWHSIISLQSGSVAYELKDGPYNPADDKQFAPWAPSEEQGGGLAFNQNVLSILGIEA